jgi:hypothetical protein
LGLEFHSNRSSTAHAIREHVVTALSSSPQHDVDASRSEVALDGSQHKRPWAPREPGRPSRPSYCRSGWKWSVLMTAGASCACRNPVRRVTRFFVAYCLLAAGG